jgi:hypothetical protein
MPANASALTNHGGEPRMTHPIAGQLGFARSELARSLAGVTDEDGERRFQPINSLGWIVGHLADQEQRYFLQRQGHPLVVEGLNERVGYGKPASTPPLSEMLDAWRRITIETASVVDAMTDADLLAYPPDDPTRWETNGTLILRVTYHYWFHLGEGQAIRQMLGHTGLPEFVGDIGEKAPFRPA